MNDDIKGILLIILMVNTALHFFVVFTLFNSKYYILFAFILMMLSYLAIIMLLEEIGKKEHLNKKSEINIYGDKE